MFDICFIRNRQKDCTVVTASIELDLPIERSVLSFNWEATHQYAAVLLERHLNKELDSAIQNARRLAYEQGWNDKKARRRKKTEFMASFTTKEIGF